MQTPGRELTPSAAGGGTMTRYDGPTLRAIRESMGVPLRRVARQVGMSHGHLSKVERGEHGRPITPAILAAYEKVTGVSLAEASSVLAEQREQLTGRRGRTWRPGQLSDMRRLAFNAAIGAIAIGGQIGEPFGRLLDSTGRPLTPITPTAAEVTQLERVAELVTSLDLRFGGGLTAQLAKTVLRWAVAMLEPAGVPDTTGRRVCAALGGLTARAAWSAVDTGAHEAARSLFRLALFAGVRSGDPDLRAHILADAAAHHSYLGYFEDALDLIRVVEGDERVAPPVRMVIHCVKSRAYAGAGEEAACRRHIELAGQSYDDGKPGDRPGWVGTLRAPGHLFAGTGHAMAVLAHHTGLATDREDARHRLSEAVAAFDPTTHARAMGLCTARLALLHLEAGEAEPGEQWARRTLSGLATVNSARLRRGLTAIRNAASARTDQPALRELVGDVDAALAAAELPYGS